MAGTGETVTYGELEARSNQGAHWLRSLGVQAGDGVAFFMDNSPRYYELIWAAQRSGVRFTCISSKLTAGEVEYIVRDSESKVLVTSKGVADVALAVAPLIEGVALFMVEGAVGPYASLEDARAGFPTTPIKDQSVGAAMLYSSGTTGRPKGVKRKSGVLVDTGFDAPSPLATLAAALYGMTADTVYLSPAPLYHAAPLGWSMGVQSLGGTVVMMEKFDPELALAYIEKYPRHLRPVRADPLRPHAEIAARGPRQVRCLLAQMRLPRRRAVPDPGQGADDGVVGSDRPRILRRHRGQRLHRHRPEEWLRKKGSVGRG